MTAHAAQGQTLPAAIVDLQIGQGTSPIASYVALTRVKTRDDLLIYRPFEHSLFTKGSLEGPSTLLKLLRGDAIDWKAIEEKYTPQRKCAGCNFARFKTEYTTFQFKRQDGYHHCNDCIEKKKENDTPHECMACHKWKDASAFSEDDLKRFVHRVCYDCEERRQCGGPCQLIRRRSEYTAGE